MRCCHCLCRQPGGMSPAGRLQQATAGRTMGRVSLSAAALGSGEMGVVMDGGWTIERSHVAASWLASSEMHAAAGHQKYIYLASAYSSGPFKAGKSSQGTSSALLAAVLEQ